MKAHTAVRSYDIAENRWLKEENCSLGWRVAGLEWILVCHFGCDLEELEMSLGSGPPGVVPQDTDTTCLEIEAEYSRLKEENCSLVWHAAKLEWMLVCHFGCDPEDLEMSLGSGPSKLSHAAPSSQ
jgi:hypothetical protein